MSDNQADKIDFTVNQENLYREESVTDLKVAAIRRLVPINVDGSEDTSRPPVFVGSTQLMSPEGPLPLQTVLEAATLEEAVKAFPEAMRKEMQHMMAQLSKMQKERKKKDSSNIIVPGR